MSLGWVENGSYGTPAAYQKWDTAEAFLLIPGITWTGTSLTINSGTGWTTALINPTYAVATTGTAYVSKTQGDFSFTTRTTDLTTGTFSFDWVLSLKGAIVGVQRSIYTPGGGWAYTEYLPKNAPVENRSPVPLPPPCCSWAAAWWGWASCAGEN